MIVEVVTIVLGLAVGLSLGALGGGGSTLAVPILVFVAGLTTQDATSASLLVVGAAAAIGVWGHFRNGNVRLGAGLGFGAAGVVGARVGTLLNRSLDEQLLLFAFSVLIVFVAFRMYRSLAGVLPTTIADTAPLPPPFAVEGDGSTLLAAPPAPPVRARLDLSPRALATLAVAATGVGLLTGLFGVGGGFAVVPALTLLLGFEAKEAIGTSLVVIAINAGIALALRSGDLEFDWGVVVPFLATVTVGVLLGSAVAHRVHATSLTRGFSIMLGLVGVYTAASTLLA